LSLSTVVASRLMRLVRQQKEKIKMSIRIVHVSELTKRPVRVPKPKKTR